jgi:hypothetical protein
MGGKRRFSGLLLGGSGTFEDAHDVAFLHDQEVLAVDLDLGARPLAEQHALADLQTSSGISLPASSRPPGPTETISPS